jgi:hypothetical protein
MAARYIQLAIQNNIKVNVEFFRLSVPFSRLKISYLDILILEDGSDR